MAKRSQHYNLYSLELGDKWYAGLDYENFLTLDNQLLFLQKFIGPCIISGWTVEKLSENRSDQLKLISEYLNNNNSEYGTKLKNLNLNFANEYICAAATTSNINLNGGAPNILDGISLSLNDTVLVKDQTDKTENGIYTVSNVGIGTNGTWSRSGILDTSSDFNSNFISYVQSGTSNTSTLWLASSLGSTFGTNEIYFLDAFEQCVKVSSGSGIVDKYFGKTESPNYFRFTSPNQNFIWADKSLNITYNNLAKISCPLPPDINYGSQNNSAYLATVISSAGSTLYDAVTVDQIIYGEKRNSYNDITSEFQKSLNLNYLKHRHLSDIYTPEKVNLNNSLILIGKNIYQNTQRKSSSVLALYNSDNSVFDVSTLSNYGIPQVYLNDVLLDENDYRFSTPSKIYLKNSILDSDTLKVVLPKYLQKKLICIDSNGVALGSTLSTSYVFLSDGTKEDRTPDDATVNLVYKNFSWSKHNYISKVFIDNLEIQDKYYTLNNDSGMLKFSSTYPELSNKNYKDVYIILDAVGSEISSKLNGQKISDINASSFITGSIGISSITNLSHNYFCRYKEQAKFNFNKFLIAGYGNSYFYPENTFSDLQFNTKTSYIYESLNFEDDSILYGSSLGLLQSKSTLKNIKINKSWKNDLGNPILIIDNLLNPLNQNYYKTTYVLTNLGNLYFKKSDFDVWSSMKLPDISGVATTAQAFDISTDITFDSNENPKYSSFAYVGVANGVYFANILDQDKQNQWSWNKIDFYDTVKLSSISNINYLKELSTLNVGINTNSPDDISIDRSLYVVSSDPNNSGLYYGNSSILTKITSGNFKGLSVIDGGSDNFNKNNIIWWDDYNVYITHTAHYHDNISSKYWDHPFSINQGSYADCQVATTENITLSGLQTIDGYTVLSNDRVLVKNQSDKKQNGIYVASSGAWTRATDLNQDFEIVYGKKVNILNGNLQSGSSWFVKYLSSYILNESEIEWDFYIYKIFSTSTPYYTAERSKIKNVVFRKSNLNTNQYLIAHTDGVVLATDENLFTTKFLNYEQPFQGNINYILSRTNNEANGEAVLCTDYGLYISTSNLWLDENLITDASITKKSWIRTENFILQNDPITVFDINSNIQNSNFEYYPQWQLIKFNQTYDSGINFYYERSFNDFYTEPWIDDILDDSGNPSDHNIAVYVNEKPSSIPFITDSSNGLIRFVNSLDPNDINNVKITISKDNPYISNNGNKTHDEIFQGANKFKKIASLIQDNSPSSNILYLTQEIDINEKILMIEYNGQKEFVYVESINNYKNPVEVEIYFTREQASSNYTFPSGSSIFSIKDTLSENILDDLYYIISKEKYNLSSVNNTNINLLNLALQNEISNLFDKSPAAIVSQNDTRGLKNSFLTNDFLNDVAFDSLKSVYKYNVGSPEDFNNECLEVINTFDIDNLSKNNLNSILVSDRGFWKYTGTRWINILRFPKINCNFIKQKSNGSFLVGTNYGLYEIDENINVNKNSLFNQEINDYYEGFIDNIKFEAYAKSDGFVMIKNPEDSNFISEYSDLVDGVRVYGINKNKIIRIENEDQIKYDCLYLSADNGFYGICNGVNADFFGTGLVTKKIINNTIPGVNRFYNCIFPYQIPSVPTNDNQTSFMLILTNDGILKCNNYKWVDPLEENHSLNIDERFLLGYECTCFATDYENSNNSDPGKSKVFIGTNKGVFRSLNGGLTFEKTERINNLNLKIFSLKIFESTFESNSANITKKVLVACTELGIYYTIDDGDTWFEIGNNTLDNENPVSGLSFPTDAINFSNNLSTGNYLAQTIQLDKTSTIDKISFKLKINKNLVDLENYESSLNNNSLEAYLCSLDGNDNPTLNILSSSSTNGIKLKELLDDELTVFDFNYSATNGQKLAIVLREVLTSGGISLMSWFKSPVNNENINGYAFTRYNGSFDKIVDNGNDYQFHFRLVYTSDLTAEYTQVAVGRNNNGDLGWNQGKFKGLFVDESGFLKMDRKMLVSFLIDDTKSMASNVKNDYIFYSKDLVNQIFEKTEKDSGNLNFTAFDFWTINDSLKRLSEGFDNNAVKTISYFDNLQKTGSFNNLFDSLDVASIGMQKQSVIELFKKENDASGNQTRIQEIVDYLNSINALRLNDIISEYNLSNQNDNWDLTANNIYQSEVASEILLSKFANSYIPVLVCITDGENNSSLDFQKIIENTSYYWDEAGFKLIIFNLSDLNNQGIFNKICVDQKGHHFQIKTNSDWITAIESLFDFEKNTLFSSSWTREINYDSPVFVDHVYSEFVKNVFAENSLVIEYRYSEDGNKYTNWINLENANISLIRKHILSIEYRVLMSQSSTVIDIDDAYVSKLYHTIVNPAELYLYSSDIDSDGYINELNASYFTSIDKTIDVEIGLNRNNSNKWSNYEIVKPYKNQILSHSQKTYDVSDVKVYSDLTILPVDDTFLVFTIMNNGNIFKWNDNYSIVVSQNLTIIENNSFRVDNNTGLITFDNIQENFDTILIEITENQNVYTLYGEKTFTSDYINYFSSQGAWTDNEKIVVFLNNEIIRKDYILDKYSGCVIFKKRLSESDVVSIYREYSNSFKVGLKIYDYSLSNHDDKYNLSLQYTTLKNLNKLSELKSVSKPFLTENRVLLETNFTNASNDLTVYSPIFVNYEFASDFDTEEKQTKVIWWRKIDGVFEILDSDNYTNRTIQRQKDLNVNLLNNTELYIEVLPIDKYKIGHSYTSDIYILNNFNKPYVNDVKIRSDENIITQKVKSNTILSAYYNFVDKDNLSDQSIVRWYDWSISPSIPIFEGIDLPSSFVNVSSVISFIVIPFNGEIYGDAIESNTINVF